MSRERPVPHNFEDEQLESVFVGRRDGQARPTVLLIPTVMGVTDLEIGFGRQLVELGYNALVADIFGKQFRGAPRDTMFGEMNRLKADAEAYRQSSPIYFAAGLKGALLLCHGMVDTNVHFQDTVRLAQKLIELHKENWELAVYPVEDHSFQQPSSWADEYKRVFRLFEQNLKKP